MLEDEAVGTPAEWWIKYGYLLVRPAPSSAGDFLFQAGTCLWSLSGNVDAERPEIFTGDDMPYLIAKSCLEIALHHTDDAKMKALIPQLQAKVARGLTVIQWNYVRRNRGEQAGFVPDTGRVPGYGYR